MLSHTSSIFNHRFHSTLLSGKLHFPLDHNFRRTTLLYESQLQENHTPLWITILGKSQFPLDHKRTTLLYRSQFHENHTSLWITITGELESSLDHSSRRATLLYGSQPLPHHNLKSSSSKRTSCSSRQLLGQAIPWYSRSLGRFPRDGLGSQQVFFPELAVYSQHC